MTDAQQRAIYEWLRPEGAQLKQCDYPQRGTWVYQWELNRISDGGPYACPPLDMNTWHGLVEEKLATERVKYVQVAFKGDYGLDMGKYKCSLNQERLFGFYEYVQHGSTAKDACYAALLQYLGVK